MKGGNVMKKRMKLFLATIVSWFMVIATVSPAFAYSTNDVTNGQVIALNQPATGVLDSGDAIQSFAFDIPADGYFNVDVKPSANTNLDDIHWGWNVAVYRAEPFKVIMSGRADHKYVSSDYGTAAGRYYVIVTAFYSGNAPINAKFDVTVNYQASFAWEKEENDSSSTANAIALNTVYTGNILNDNDTDWYSFDMPSRGYVNLNINADAKEDLNEVGDGWQLTLYRGDGTLIRSFDWSSKFTSQNLPVSPGHYLVDVNGRNYKDGFDYNFSVSFTPTDDWEIEPNNESAQATAIAFNKTYHGYLTDYNDVDWYSFSIAHDSRVSLDFGPNANTDLSSIGDGWDVYLNNAADTYVYFDDAASSQSKAVDLKAGTYFIKVVDHSGSIYDLTVRLLSQTQPQVQPSASTPAPAVTNTPVQTATNTPASTSTPAVKKTQTTKPAPAVTKTSATKTKKTQPKKKTVNKKLKLGKAAIKKAKAGRKAINVSWKKVNKAKSYQISYKDVKSKKWITKSTKKLSYSIKKLRSKKKYSVRVRAVSGKTAGSWSKVKTLRVR